LATLPSADVGYFSNYYRLADKPGHGTEKWNEVTLNDFVRVAQIFELPASLIR
jgi:hypothetical protein